MTNAELKTRFLIGYEFIANNLAPGYTDAEISGFLNQGMDLLVDDFYGRGDVANIAELLVKNSLILLPAVSGTDPEDYGPSSYWVALTNYGLIDLRWLTNAKAKVTRTEPFYVNAEWIECNQITKQEAEKWVSTSINKPIIVYPKIIWHGGVVGFAVIGDSYSTISELQIIYIKNATRIDVSDGLTCELHSKLHQKIVDKAIALAMKATDAQRAQGEIQINQAI